MFKNHFYFLFYELSVHNLCSFCTDCWSFYWCEGALCVRDPFAGYEFQITFTDLSVNVAYGVFSCHLKNWFSSCCEPGMVCPMYV